MSAQLEKFLSFDEVKQYASLWGSLGPSGDKISGQAAWTFLQRSKLPESLLRRVCELADADHDTNFTLGEFCVAMHLVKYLRKAGPGAVLPDQLPESLFQSVMKLSAGEARVEVMRNSETADLTGAHQGHGNPSMLELLKEKAPMSATAVHSEAFAQGSASASGMGFETSFDDEAAAKASEVAGTRGSGEPGKRLAGSGPVSTMDPQRRMMQRITSSPGLQVVMPAGAGQVDPRQQMVQQSPAQLWERPTSFSYTAQQPGLPRLVPEMTGSSFAEGLIPKDQQEWIIPPAAREKFSKTFAKADYQNEGSIGAARAYEVFAHSKLPPETLKRICLLADVDKDAKLNLHEFIVAMFLIHRAMKGRTLPPVLPAAVLESAQVGMGVLQSSAAVAHGTAGESALAASKDRYEALSLAQREQSQIDGLQSELASAKAARELTDENYEAAQVATRELSEKVRTLRESVGNARSTVAEMQGKIQFLAKEYDRLMTQKQTLEEQVEKGKQIVTAATQEADAQQKIVDAVASENDKLTEELTALREQTRELAARVSANSELEHENELTSQRLNSDLQDLKVSFGRDSVRLQRQERTLESQRVQIEEMRRSHEALEAQKTALKEKMGVQDGLLEHQEHELATLKQEVETAKAEAEAHREHIASQEKKIQETQRLKEVSIEQLAAIQAELGFSVMAEPAPTEIAVESATAEFEEHSEDRVLPSVVEVTSGSVVGEVEKDSSVDHDDGVDVSDVPDVIGVSEAAPDTSLDKGEDEVKEIQVGSVFVETKGDVAPAETEEQPAGEIHDFGDDFGGEIVVGSDDSKEEVTGKSAEVSAAGVVVDFSGDFGGDFESEFSGDFGDAGVGLDEKEQEQTKRQTEIDFGKDLGEPERRRAADEWFMPGEAKKEAAPAEAVVAGKQSVEQDGVKSKSAAQSGWDLPSAVDVEAPVDDSVFEFGDAPSGKGSINEFTSFGFTPASQRPRQFQFSGFATEEGGGGSHDDVFASFDDSKGFSGGFDNVGGFPTPKRKTEETSLAVVSVPAFSSLKKADSLKLKSPEGSSAPPAKLMQKGDDSSSPQMSVDVVEVSAVAVGESAIKQSSRDKEELGTHTAESPLSSSRGNRRSGSSTHRSSSHHHSSSSRRRHRGERDEKERDRDADKEKDREVASPIANDGEGDGDRDREDRERRERRRRERETREQRESPDTPESREAREQRRSREHRDRERRSHRSGERRDRERDRERGHDRERRYRSERSERKAESEGKPADVRSDNSGQKEEPSAFAVSFGSRDWTGESPVGPESLFTPPGSGWGDDNHRKETQIEGFDDAFAE